jgi:putative YhbY family RNA-binding protein
VPTLQELLDQHKLPCKNKATKRTTSGWDMPKLWKTNANPTQEQRRKQALSKLTAGMKRRIKRKLSYQKPTIWIGKNQVSPETLKEITKQLERNEMVKIKILKSALQTITAEEMASMVSQQTESALVEARGHTFMLYKRHYKSIKK